MDLLMDYFKIAVAVFVVLVAVVLACLICHECCRSVRKEYDPEAGAATCQELHRISSPLHSQQLHEHVPTTLVGKVTSRKDPGSEPWIRPNLPPKTVIRVPIHGRYAAEGGRKPAETFQASKRALSPGRVGRWEAGQGPAAGTESKTFPGRPGRLSSLPVTFQTDNKAVAAASRRVTSPGRAPGHKIATVAVHPQTVHKAERKDIRLQLDDEDPESIYESATASTADTATPPCYCPNPITGDVTRVTDGDGFELKHLCLGQASVELKIRLAGIDAPEMQTLCNTCSKNIEAQPYSQKSKAYLTNLVSGKPLTLEKYGLDQYGRILAMAYWPDPGKPLALNIENNVNKAMLALGLAWVYTRKNAKYGEYKKEFFAAVAEAKRLKRGLWASGSDCVSPMEYKRLHRATHLQPITAAA